LLKIQKFELSPRLTLTVATTDKFKTGLMSVNAITQLSEADASKNALLPKVLRRGTSTLPDMRRISEVLDDLYGAAISPVVRKIGELQCIGFYSAFVDDDYVPGDEKIVERVSALLGEMLLMPATSGGRLISDYVESEKRNRIDEIRAEINDKRAYAREALVRGMCADEAYGVSRLGTEKTMEAITAQSLTAHYKTLIDTAKLEVLYIGAAEPVRVRDAVASAFAALPKTKPTAIPGTEVRIAPASGEVREFSEKLDVVQGKLSLGFRMGEVMHKPDYAAMAVFNAAFGGSLTSKLFLNVREKLSLCYYASSAIDRTKGIMTVSSGVEFANLERARAEILKNLDAIRDGDISDWELLSAQRAVSSGLLALLDDPHGLEMSVFNQMMAGIPYTPDEFAALAETVSRESIVEIANSVKLDSVYCMYGLDNTAEGA